MLNTKQIRFTEEYLIDMNATQAAVRAGYSARCAHAQGHRLLKDAEIKRVIEMKKEELVLRNEVTRDEVVGVLREAIRLAKTDESPARASNALTNAAYKLAVVCGLEAPQRQEITQKQAPPPPLPSLEEMLAAHQEKSGKLDS